MFPPPNRPVSWVERAGLGAGAFARGVSVHEGWAYVASEGYGVQVVDVRDPANPQVSVAGGRVDTRGTAVRVSVQGNAGFVADVGGGVTLLNTAPAGSISLAGAFDTTGEAGGLAVVGDHVLVADDSRLLVMSVAGMFSGPNEAPAFLPPGPARADEDAGSVAITNWVTGIQQVPRPRRGSASGCRCGCPSRRRDDLLRRCPCCRTTEPALPAGDQRVRDRRMRGADRGRRQGWRTAASMPTRRRGSSRCAP